MPQDELNARRVLPWLDAEDHHRAHRVLFWMAVAILVVQALVVVLLILR